MPGPNRKGENRERTMTQPNLFAELDADLAATATLVAGVRSACVDDARLLYLAAARAHLEQAKQQLQTLDLSLTALEKELAKAAP